MTRALFITGTGTGVGKTFVASALLNNTKFSYWKPVQTGSGDADGDDTAAAWAAAGRQNHPPFQPFATYHQAASPDQAAAAEGRAAPTVAALVAATEQVRAATRDDLVVEGAGGLLVPLNDAGETWADYLAATALPALVVASPALGTLNHTSLTLAHMASRGLPVLGVVLSGPAHPENMATLRRLYPDVPFLAFPGDDPAPLLAFVDAAWRRLDERRDPTAWLEDDRRHVWHPYTQHQTAPAPLPIARARGVWLTMATGERLLDGTSSWWVNTIGHGRPEIAAAIARQQQTLDHVIFAGATHAPAAAVAARLAALTGGLLPRVFFSDNGSTAVEIALKIAYQGWVNAGERGRTRFVSFRGSYHGDTFGAMAVAQSEAFHGAFRPLLFETLAADLPATEDTVGAHLGDLERLLDAHDGRVAGVVVEPLLQGAGGMRLHPVTFLKGLERLCRTRRLPLILDEVFTGLGRVGAPFAFQRAGIEPDIVCAAKGLTGGNLPLAVTLAKEAAFAGFLSADKGQALLHGHSYTGNAIACAAALAALDILSRDDLPGRALRLEAAFLEWIAAHGAPLALVNPRALGGVLAFELPGSGASNYHHSGAAAVPEAARKEGLFLRPLGNTVYFMPPLTITDDERRFALEALTRAVSAISGTVRH